MKREHIDDHRMREALALAKKGRGLTSPNPMVGAVLVKSGRIIGRGWHRRAGLPHAEIEAIHDAQKRGHSLKGATLYVTLEPCCTHGRTPPCTDAIIAARIKRVVIGAIDPNPRHAGRALKILRRAGIAAGHGTLETGCARLNESFNHWIRHHTPFVTVKAAMTLDGKIATAAGESKWITGNAARARAMTLRRDHDAILVGVNTVLFDDPSLTLRGAQAKGRSPLRRIVLDPMARMPLTAKVVSDELAPSTTVVVSAAAPKRNVTALSKRTNVIVMPSRNSRIDLRRLMKRLGSENVTSLLVEGGGETNATFLAGRLAHRIAFFYAPTVMGGRDARRAVAGDGVKRLDDAIRLRDVEWTRIGKDLLLTALVADTQKK